MRPHADLPTGLQLDDRDSKRVAEEHHYNALETEEKMDEDREEHLVVEPILDLGGVMYKWDCSQELMVAEEEVVGKTNTIDEIFNLTSEDDKDESIPGDSTFEDESVYCEGEHSSQSTEESSQECSQTIITGKMN